MKIRSNLDIIGLWFPIVMPTYATPSPQKKFATISRKKYTILHAMFYTMSTLKKEHVERPGLYEIKP